MKKREREGEIELMLFALSKKLSVSSFLADLARERRGWNSFSGRMVALTLAGRGVALGLHLLYFSLFFLRNN